MPWSFYKIICFTTALSYTQPELVRPSE